MQVQQEALTEEEVALLHQVQPVQICLQPQPDLVLCMPLHWSTSYNICAATCNICTSHGISNYVSHPSGAHVSAYLWR